MCPLAKSASLMKQNLLSFNMNNRSVWPPTVFYSFKSSSETTSPGFRVEPAIVAACSQEAGAADAIPNEQLHWLAAADLGAVLVASRSAPCPARMQMAARRDTGRSCIAIDLYLFPILISPTFRPRRRALSHCIPVHRFLQALPFA
jgi:hypothetical protein